MKKITTITCLLCCIMIGEMHAQLVHQYGVATNPWDEDFGNHRALIHVTAAGASAYVKLYWRRQDDPADKQLIITDKAGKRVVNIYRLSITREAGEFIFEPISGPGEYAVYYMPYHGKKNSGSWEGKYLLREPAPDQKWLAAIDQKKMAPNAAEVIRIESRTAFDSFYPMEVCATIQETTNLVQKFKQPFLLFPEDRFHPIRMRHDLPVRWIDRGMANHFTASVLKNEYFAFQLGLFAAESELRNIRVSYKGFYKLTCFNTEGVDADGKAFSTKLHLAKGGVQALWFGADISASQRTGPIDFDIMVTADNFPAKKVHVRLNVSDSSLADRGDGDPARHSRLRWLNSRQGINDEVSAPYTSMQLTDKTIRYKMGELGLSNEGLPQQIMAGTQLLTDKPVRFIIETATGIESLQPQGLRFLERKAGAITWQARAANQKISLVINGRMEFDGSIQYRCSVLSGSLLIVKDIRLELPVAQQQAQLFMGMGLPGMACPAQYDWKWEGPTDSYWIGSAQAGVHCELEGASYTGPLLNLYHPAPPPSWYNGDKGGFSIRSSGNETVTTTYSGERTLQAGKPADFQFRLLITPMHRRNTEDQFTNRYFHNGNSPEPTATDRATGIRIVNLHHANPYNPYINYPFIAVDSMRAFVQRCHAHDLKAKIYYTIRELTSLVPEIWALRSLGDEVFADGEGGGYPWLQEHLVSNYDVQWFTSISHYEKPDAAIRTSGKSRWYNYYVEGLKWLVKNVDIDGLYLDDVSFDRNMLKRMRHMMDAVKPGCLIDLHSNTGFSKGPATQYAEYFPFINKIWFGESFQYDKMSPENWLVESSGIPFGLMGDMLQGGGNPWRGMVYGMTARYPWKTEGVICSPEAIWKLWDEFDIAHARMIGYWEKECPVKTNNPRVLATVYQHKDKILVSLASWDKQPTDIKLEINWQAIGIDPAKATLNLPQIEKFQEAVLLQPGESLRIDPAKGVLIVIK